MDFPQTPFQDGDGEHLRALAVVLEAEVERLRRHTRISVALSWLNALCILANAALMAVWLHRLWGARH